MVFEYFQEQKTSHNKRVKKGRMIRRIARSDLTKRRKRRMTREAKSQKRLYVKDGGFVARRMNRKGGF